MSTRTSPAGNKRQHLNQQGFSLLEVIVVVTLIGLAYALLPKLIFSGVSGPELKSNVRAVATGLRLTRDAAIRQAREARLTLDLEARTFLVEGDSRVHRLNEKLDVKLFTAQSDLITEKAGSIRFFADGSSNGGRITVGAGGREFAVDVDWLSGQVRVNEMPGEGRG